MRPEMKSVLSKDAVPVTHINLEAPAHEDAKEAPPAPADGFEVSVEPAEVDINVDVAFE